MILTCKCTGTYYMILTCKCTGTYYMILTCKCTGTYYMILTCKSTCVGHVKALDIPWQVYQHFDPCSHRRVYA